MTTLILTRHGLVPGIHPERFRGRVEVALSPAGERQAAALAARISTAFRPVAIYTSALGRCIATGAAIGTACGIEPQSRPELSDIDYGAWQWKTHEEVEAEDGDAYLQWRTAPHLVRFPGGESLQDVLVRAADMLRHVLSAHAGESVVLVGHDSVNRVLLCHLLGLPLSAYWRFKQDPCNLNIIEWTGADACLVRCNDTAHLQPA